MKIALIRHGRTEWNEAGRLQGRTDIPLSETDRERLAGLVLPPPWDGADILSSPMRRARETAEILTGRRIQMDAALVEMNLGDWEGKRGTDLLEDPASGYCHVEERGWDGRPPGGGETFREVLIRVDPVLSGLARNTVVVSHMNVMRVMLATAHDWHFDEEMPFRIKRNRLYVLRREDDGWAVEGEPVRLVER